MQINIVEELLKPQELSKSILNVISEEIIMACNVDGVQNRKRFLNYPKVVDLLFRKYYLQPKKKITLSIPIFLF